MAGFDRMQSNLQRQKKLWARAAATAGLLLLFACAEPRMTAQAVHTTADAHGLTLRFPDGRGGRVHNCQRWTVTEEQSEELCAFRFADSELSNWIVLRLTWGENFIYAPVSVDDFREATTLEGLMGKALVPEGERLTDEDRAAISRLGRFDSDGILGSRADLENVLRHDIRTFVAITHIENRQTRCAVAASSYITPSDAQTVGCSAEELARLRAP